MSQRLGQPRRVVAERKSYIISGKNDEGTFMNSIPEETNLAEGTWQVSLAWASLEFETTVLAEEILVFGLKLVQSHQPNPVSRTWQLIETPMQIARLGIKRLISLEFSDKWYTVNCPSDEVSVCVRYCSTGRSLKKVKEPCRGTFKIDFQRVV